MEDEKLEGDVRTLVQECLSTWPVAPVKSPLPPLTKYTSPDRFGLPPLSPR